MVVSFSVSDSIWLCSVIEINLVVTGPDATVVLPAVGSSLTVT